MRTTVRLDDELMHEVKRYAAEKKLSLTKVLDRALREMLTRRRKQDNRQQVQLPTFRGRGLQPGVDLDDSSALLELMENSNGPA
jgi:hypothetical protein